MSSTIRTESAGISTARQSLDNVLSAKANLEQTSSSPQSSTDKHCALEFQIAELEGMLSEIMDERFARTIDESQWDDGNRNVGLLNLIIDTADNMLASLSPASNTPPPTYQKNHLNIQTTPSHARKPKVESRDSTFPLPHDQRDSKRRRSLHTLLKRKSKVDHPTSTNTAVPFPLPVPAKSTNNSKLVGSPKPLSLSNPFRNVKEASQDFSSIDDLSLSAFQALKQSDAFKALVDRTESKQIRDIDRDNLWFSFRDVFDDNLSKELFCAFELLIRVSSAERSSKDATNSGRMNSDEPTSRFTNKGKAPLRGVAPDHESPSSSSSSPSPSSPSESIDSDFVTIESPDNTKPTTSQPPPYTQHLTTLPPPPPPLPPTKAKTEPVSCINCGLTVIGNKVLKVHACGHVFCRECAEELCKEYIWDDDGYRGVGRCRCDKWVSNLDVDRFLDGHGGGLMMG